MSLYISEGILLSGVAYRQVAFLMSLAVIKSIDYILRIWISVEFKIFIYQIDTV